MQAEHERPGACGQDARDTAGGTPALRPVGCSSLLCRAPANNPALDICTSRSRETGACRRLAEGGYRNRRLASVWQNATLFRFLGSGVHFWALKYLIPKPQKKRLICLICLHCLIFIC